MSSTVDSQDSEPVIEEQSCALINEEKSDKEEAVCQEATETIPTSECQPEIATISEESINIVDKNASADTKENASENIDATKEQMSESVPVENMPEATLEKEDTTHENTSDTTLTSENASETTSSSETVVTSENALQSESAAEVVATDKSVSENCENPPNTEETCSSMKNMQIESNESTNKEHVENNESNEADSAAKSTPDKGECNWHTSRSKSCETCAENRCKASEMQACKSNDRRSPSPLRARDQSSSGCKVKRKSRSTRRRLNAMINNSSLHFSDTDSEGELTMITVQSVRAPSSVQTHSPCDQSQPTISVTLDRSVGESGDRVESNSASLLPGQMSNATSSRRGSFVEDLTDVDEIYTSEPEAEQKPNENMENLTVAENSFQAETEFEDLSIEEQDLHSPIYLLPRSDIFKDFHGETITTKEGDGPFSIEIRNQMSLDTEEPSCSYQDTPDIVIMPTTDSEDMEVSENEDLEEGACSQQDPLEDLDVLVASQIVMKNVNKTDNTLNVRDASDEVPGDCHTDVEDV